MEGTLVYSDTIQRAGYTVIDGVKVVQHVCTIPLADPKAMRVTMVKLNNDMYREHRDVCRADFATFEDSAFQLQEECLARESK